MTLDQVEDQQKANAEALHKLELEAGIAEAADKAQEGPLIPMLPDAPYGTEEHRLQIEESFTFERAYVRRRIRKVYFGVADLELRKRLIGKYREGERLRKSWFDASVRQSHAKLSKSISASSYWWVIASIGAVIAVMIGNDLYHLPGAIAGAVVALFIGLAIYQEDQKRSHDAVTAAESELSDSKRVRDEVMKEPETFSRTEESTGEEEPVRRFATA